ncbi:hypothetical protein MW887_011535 [Aspergillus wentii]|nr:hypothetical protein MW887_011535 [Aspergillus wentii]
MKTKAWEVPEVHDVAAGDKEARGYVRAYLQRFGYLDRSRAPDQYSFEEDDSAALGRLQRFLGLSVSGQYDSDTADAMKAKRCGFPDTPNSIASFSLRNAWPRRPLTWKLVNLVHSTVGLSRKQIYASLKAALDRWEKFLPRDMWFEMIPDRNNENGNNVHGIDDPDAADMLVKFARQNHGDGAPFDGPGNVLAHAFFPPPNAGYLAGDLHFDEDEDWTQENFLMQVALHEFGHSLGLAHSADPNAVMYPFFKGRSELQDDDIAGIRELYGG